MESMYLAAITTAIIIENKSLSFYNALASKAVHENTKRIFEQLMHEEREHLELFCKIYPENEDNLIELLFRSNMYADPYYCSLMDSVDKNADEKFALEIALKEEQACIEWYTVFAETIRVPHIRDLFVRILDETFKHSNIIKDEYLRLGKTVSGRIQENPSTSITGENNDWQYKQPHIP